MNEIRQIIIFLLIFLFLISCSEKGKDPFPEFVIPVYENSYDIKTGIGKFMYGKSINYYIQEKFPATNVHEFYKNFLLKRNFSELKKYPYSDESWVRFNKESLKWDIIADSPPARYHSAWTDSHENLIFKLTLYHEDNDKLSVTCFIHPYIGHDPFNEIHMWVKDNGKEQEFAEILTKYVDSDGKLKIEQALIENPDSELITKFAKAAEQMEQDNEAAYKAYKKSINIK